MNNLIEKRTINWASIHIRYKLNYNLFIYYNGLITNFPKYPDFKIDGSYELYNSCSPIGIIQYDETGL
jgi:hypothetical protein